MKTSSTVKNVIKWLIFSCFVLIFSAVTYDMSAGAALFTDNYIYENIVLNVRNDTLTIIFKYITFMGSAAGLIILTGAIFIIVKDKKIGVCIGCNLVLITVFNLIVKNIIQRPRPPEERMLVYEGGFSFPSGHSMVSFAFYGLILYFIIRFCKNKTLKAVFSVLIPILIMGIGISRIYLGMHYFSDVLSAFSLSGAYLIIYTYVIKNIFDKKK